MLYVDPQVPKSAQPPTSITKFLNTAPKQYSTKPGIDVFPTITGVHRLSQRHVGDDMLEIQAKILNSQEALLSSQNQEFEEELQDDKRPKRKSARINSGNNSNQNSELQDESLMGQSKRSRLLNKIIHERASHMQVKARLINLRSELDSIRLEVLQYEDAIATTKREIEIIKREKQMLADQFSMLKEEYSLSYESAEAARIEEEKTEAELRERLTHSSTAASDAQQRVDQLRAIEEEFKAKDAKIDQQAIEIRRLQLHSQILKKTLQSIGAVEADTRAAFARIKAEKEKTVNPNDPNTNAASTNNSENFSSNSSPSSLSVLVSYQNELLQHCRTQNDQLCTFEKTIKSLQSEKDDLTIKLLERERHLQTMHTQLERFTKINLDLQQSCKLTAGIFHASRVRHDTTLTQLKMLLQEKDEQAAVISAFEEKLKSFEHVLSLADNRGNIAEKGIRDITREIRVLRAGSREMQKAYNRVLGDFTALNSLVEYLLCELGFEDNQLLLSPVSTPMASNSNSLVTSSTIASLPHSNLLGSPVTGSISVSLSSINNASSGSPSMRVHIPETPAHKRRISLLRRKSIQIEDTGDDMDSLLRHSSSEIRSALERMKNSLVQNNETTNALQIKINQKQEVIEQLMRLLNEKGIPINSSSGLSISSEASATDSLNSNYNPNPGAVSVSLSFHPSSSLSLSHSPYSNNAHSHSHSVSALPLPHSSFSLPAPLPPPAAVTMAPHSNGSDNNNSTATTNC